MNLFLASILFSAIVLIYWIILEMFTVMFRITGLPDDKARFQVLSILTGAGYTTKESESFVSSKMRRKLAQVTMLFGYVFNVSIVSALVNVFFSLKEAQVDTFFVGIVIPLMIAALVIRLIRTRFIRKRIDRVFSRIAGKIMKQDKVNTVLLMDYIGHDSIANVILKEVPEALAGKTLMESRLKQEHGIQVLLVERDGIRIERAKAETIFKPGDRLTVFGTYFSALIKRSARFSRRRSAFFKGKGFHERSETGDTEQHHGAGSRERTVCCGTGDGGSSGSCRRGFVLLWGAQKTAFREGI